MSKLSLLGKCAACIGWLCGMSNGAQAAALEFTVRNVPVPGPICFKPEQKLDGKTQLVLDDGQGTIIPAQPDTDGRLWWYQPVAADAKGRAYTLREAKNGEVNTTGVKVEEAKAGTLNITLDGQPFAAFNYGPDTPKPYLYPVIGPTGAGVTRNFPMKDVPEERAQGKRKSRQDHPHHRSIWTAHGDVRLGDFEKVGTDYWAVGKDKGLQKVAKITAVRSGPVFGLIEADIDWTNAAGKKELSETRTYRFFKAGPDQRIIDVKVIFKFTEGDVMFADTKEGGILSIRLAVSMDEVTAGKMFNSEGRVGEKECWGKHAAWCDYVGPVDGKTVGVAVFDAKTNFRHPTPWHIRAYGLYTANPFGLLAFGEKNSGAHTWKKGETAESNYRVLIHAGDTKQAKIAEQYGLFVGAPDVVAK